MNKYHTRPATSLVEVLIVLAIAATSLIAVTSFQVKSLIQLNDSATVDAANAYVIKIMELGRSPKLVDIDSNSTGQNFDSMVDYKYSIDNVGTQGELKLVAQPLNDPNIYTDSSFICDANSKYWISLIDDTASNLRACLQLIVTKLNDKYYRLNTNVGFVTSFGQIVNQYTIYRRGNFSVDGTELAVANLVPVSGGTNNPTTSLCDTNAVSCINNLDETACIAYLSNSECNSHYLYNYVLTTCLSGYNWQSQSSCWSSQTTYN